MSARHSVFLGLALAAVVAALYLVPMLARWGDGPAPPASVPITVPGAPAAVYEAILPEIRDRVARDTKIVRVDGAAGIDARFSAYLEDHSVRLVEIQLAPAPEAATCVSITSRRFSFVPGRQRDAQDAALEASLGQLIRRHTEAVRPSDARP